jgi:hypothetical protein
MTRRTLEEAKQYLAERKLLATAPDSEFRYTNSTGHRCPRPKFLKRPASPAPATNFVFVSGDVDALQLKPGERRFRVASSK